MTHWSLGALVVLPVAVCGGAFVALGSGAPTQEIARESLDLLKGMAHRSATAQTYVGTCITAIADAKRIEDRKDPPGTIDAIWVQAAGRCRVLAHTLCDTVSLEAPRESCNRIRAFDAVLH